MELRVISSPDPSFAFGEWGEPLGVRSLYAIRFRPSCAGQEGQGIMDTFTIPFGAGREAVRLVATRPEDMLHRDPPNMEEVAQQPAVAVPEKLLRAHDCGALALGDSQELFNSPAKFSSGHMVGVVAEGGVFQPLIW